MSTLTDDDLIRLLDDAASGFSVPDDGPAGVLAALEAPVSRPLRARRPVQVAAAAALVAAAFAGGSLLQSGDAAPEVARQAAPAEESSQAAPASPGGATADLLQVESAAPPVPAPQAPAALSGLSPAAAAGAADAARQSQPSDAAAPGVQAPAPDGARIVKTGSIALLVGDGRVTPTLTAVQELATAAGGLVQAAETQESGRSPSGSVVLRVPVARFEEVVSQVRSLDAQVRAATTSGRDVTAEYADVEAQLRTLRAARERFLEILTGARAIGDVLAVQQKVDEVTGQIERLEGQRAVLQSQSESATLEVTVTEEGDPAVAVTEKPDDGLGKAFRDAWDGFTSGVEALVAASGRAALVLLCLLAALLVGRLAWRAGRRRLV